MRKIYTFFLLALLGAQAVEAQTYPVKPVRMLVGIAPGGGLDTGTRTVAGKLAEILGQPFIVENRAGGGGSIAAAAVVNATADGYTLLMATSTIMIHPAVFANLPYDPIKSFTPVGTAGTELLVISVNPSVPVKTTAELIALLRANPGKFNYGTPGVGTAHHLAMEMFKKQTGVDIVHIPYKGAALVTPDLISGQIPMAMMSVNTTLPQAKAGKIRAIAISSPVKIPAADWPAISETLPGFDASSTRMLMGPAGMSREIVMRLSDALRRMLASEDTQRAFMQQGAHWQFVGPDELAASMRVDLPKWMAAAKDAGVKPE
ncbi:MAG: Bug family tripartite tricarboxylate transporter substrate binding protein [Burkholderiales bacterium]